MEITTEWMEYRLFKFEWDGWEFSYDEDYDMYHFYKDGKKIKDDEIKGKVVLGKIEEFKKEIEKILYGGE